jgi:excisionase family DNA binding protein
MIVLDHKSITAQESERTALNKIKGVLNNSTSVPKLVGPDGDFIELPQSLFEALKQVAYYMMRGRSVFIVPDNKELTTQQAADILQVSRPYLIRLLDEKKIPYSKVGTHRRIRFVDLINYKAQRAAEREKALDEIMQISEELGLYD